MQKPPRQGCRGGVYRDVSTTSSAFRVIMTQQSNLLIPSYCADLMTIKGQIKNKNYILVVVIMKKPRPDGWVLLDGAEGGT